MHSLNALINQGKVLYLGISDAPAWIVTKANMYARQNGLRPFSIYQGRYSAQERDLEREVIPMVQEEGMALQPFGVLGSGLFKSPDKPAEGARKMPPPMLIGREEALSKILDTVAKRHSVPITSVALAYVLQKVCVFVYTKKSCHQKTLDKNRETNESPNHSLPMSSPFLVVARWSTSRPTLRRSAWS